jgi:hypothetical protein
VAAFIEAEIDNNKNIKDIYLSKKFDSMKVVVIDRKLNVHIRKPLNVKIKYLLGDKAKKKGMMHCGGKCLHITKKDDFTNLEWWIKLLRKTGYDKKYLCDHMIEKHESFARLFEEHKDFLEIDKLTCIPNLLPYRYLANQMYLKSFRDLLLLENGAYNISKYIKYDVINVLIYNECYMNNIDKYRHIALTDTDEIVLPKQIRNFSTFESVRDLISNIDFENIERQNNPFGTVKCDKNVNISVFLENDLITRLNATGNIDHEISLNFKHGSYIFNDIVDELFTLLKVKLQQLNISNFDSLRGKQIPNLTIEAVVANRAQEFKLDMAFSFTITGRDELLYAMSLLQMYEKYVEPFVSKHKNDFATKVGTFDRLFYVSGELNDHLYGKTIHNTRRSMDLTVHYGVGYMNIDKNGKPDFVKNHYYANVDFKVPRQLAHLSHYRTFLNFDQRSSVVPFSAFHFDLNYFKCFMIPLLLEN